MRKTTTLFLILACLFCGITQINAQNPVWKWAFGYGGNGGDGAHAITTDKTGNTIFTGTSASDQYTFGPFDFNPPSGCGGEMFIVKSDSLGNILWVKNYTGMGQTEWPQTIICDTAGNMYVGGYFESAKFIIGNDTLINSQPGLRNIFLLKLNQNGDPIWAKWWGGSKTEELNHMAVDKLGNIYITGLFKSDSIGFGNIIVEKYDTTINNPNDHDFYVAKISPQGIPLWAHSYGGDYITECNAIVVDQNNNAFIAGNFRCDSLRFGDTTFYNDEYIAPFMVKFDASGNIIWANHKKITQSLKYNNMTIDNNGKLYVIGDAYSTVNIGGASIYSKIFLAGFDNNGNELWGKGICNRGTSDEILSIDSHNDIIVSFSGLTSIADSLSLPDSLDLFLIKYSNLGEKVWAINYGNAWNFCYGMALSNNSIYLAGKYGGDMVYGDSILVGGAADIFVAKLNGGGSSGIYENTLNSTLFLYPNPSTGQFLIKNPLNTIEIYDFKGLLLLKETNVSQTEKQIDISKYSKGLYFVKSYDKSGLKKSVQKIIIN
ncbi:MAG: T9SS type A sorting domain-containing protein [Bacteroidota bacterium]